MKLSSSSFVLLLMLALWHQAETSPQVNRRAIALPNGDRVLDVDNSSLSRPVAASVKPPRKHLSLRRMVASVDSFGEVAFQEQETRDDAWRYGKSLVEEGISLEAQSNRGQPPSTIAPVVLPGAATVALATPPVTQSVLPAVPAPTLPPAATPPPTQAASAPPPFLPTLAVSPPGVPLVANTTATAAKGLAKDDNGTAIGLIIGVTLLAVGLMLAFLCWYHILPWIGDTYLSNRASCVFLAAGNSKFQETWKDFIVALGIDRSCPLCQFYESLFHSQEVRGQLEKLFEDLAQGSEELSVHQVEELCLAMGGTSTNLNTGMTNPLPPATLRDHWWLFENFDRVFTPDWPLTEANFPELLKLVFMWRWARYLRRRMQAEILTTSYDSTATRSNIAFRLVLTVDLGEGRAEFKTQGEQHGYANLRRLIYVPERNR